MAKAEVEHHRPQFGGKVFETKLNVLLGRLLSNELGLRAISEYIAHKGRSDVIVYVNGVKVVIEGRSTTT